MKTITKWLQIILIVVALTAMGKTYFLNQRLDKIETSMNSYRSKVADLKRGCVKEIQRLKAELKLAKEVLDERPIVQDN